MAGQSDSRIDDDRHMALFDDDLDHVAGAQSEVGADGRAKRHDRRRARILAMPRQDGVGVDVGQYDHAKLRTFLDCLQRLDGIGQKIAGVRVYLDLEPVEACRLSDLRDAHRLGRIARAGRIEHYFDLASVDGAEDAVVRRVCFMHACERDGDKFRLARRQRGLCLFAARELPRSEKEPVCELLLSNDQRFHPISPFRSPCPAEAQRRRWPPLRRRCLRAG